MIDHKKNDAIASLNNQLQLLKSNFNFIRNHSKAVFNGRFQVTFGSLDEVSIKANKFTPKSELALFIQALNDQIYQRKNLFEEPKNVESKINQSTNTSLE